MPRYRYRLVNVFADTTFGGNPLCVFEDARGLSDAQMHAITRQFNLSETSFILPSERASATVRVFAPGHEMRFAGHPALGSAHVLRALRSSAGESAQNDHDALTLLFQAGVVPLHAVGDIWRFAAPGAAAMPAPRLVDRVPAALAAGFGLTADDLAAPPCWLDTGSEQMLVPLRSAAALRRAAPQPAWLDDWPANAQGRRGAYLFALDGERGGVAQIQARYFFVSPNGCANEDPGTGSACANLGAWCISQGHALPLRCSVEQGTAMGRPCHLQLEVDVERRIWVGGRVIELGQGYLDL
jgi:PhzF family phenazine biosynthesis protein